MRIIFPTFSLLPFIHLVIVKAEPTTTLPPGSTFTLNPPESSAASAFNAIFSLHSAVPPAVKSAQSAVPSRLISDFLFNPTAADVTSYLGSVSLASDVASNLKSLVSAEASVITSIYSTPTLPSLHIQIGGSETSASSSAPSSTLTASESAAGGSGSASASASMMTSSASAVATSATPTGAAAGQKAVKGMAVGGLAIAVLVATVLL